MTPAIITQGGVRQALEALLSTLVGAGDINLESAALYLPKANTPYVSGRISAYTRVPMGVGYPTPCEVNGMYQINVNRPAIEGADMAASVAARVVALFQRGTALVLTTGPVLTVLQAGEQPLITAGDWLTVPVVVSFSGAEGI